MTDFLTTHADLLAGSNVAHVATSRPDGSLQVNPMWFTWVEDTIRLTCTTDRQKTINLQQDPRVSLSIVDPDNPYRYLEVRGTVERIEPDAEGTFFTELADRYGMDFGGPPADKDRRVQIVVAPNAVSGQ